MPGYHRALIMVIEGRSLMTSKNEGSTATNVQNINQLPAYMFQISMYGSRPRGKKASQTHIWRKGCDEMHFEHACMYLHEILLLVQCRTSTSLTSENIGLCCKSPSSDVPLPVSFPMRRILQLGSASWQLRTDAVFSVWMRRNKLSSNSNVKPPASLLHAQSNWGGIMGEIVRAEGWVTQTGISPRRPLFMSCVKLSKCRHFVTR